MAVKHVVFQLAILVLAYTVVGFPSSNVTTKMDIDGHNVTDILDASTITAQPTTEPNTTVVPPTTALPNTTTSTTTPTTTTSTIPTTITTTVTTTAVPTTTVTPNTTTSTPTTTVAPTTPPTNATTTEPTKPTTESPHTTAAPSHGRRFDGPSFFGGIILACGLMAIGFVSWKFYKARTERNYHTL